MYALSLHLNAKKTFIGIAIIIIIIANNNADIDANADVSKENSL